jgi:hypothetical protein
VCEHSDDKFPVHSRQVATKEDNFVPRPSATYLIAEPSAFVVSRVYLLILHGVPFAEVLAFDATHTRQSALCPLPI